MSLWLFLIASLKICYAHPFDSRVVGHKMEVELRKKTVKISYQLELPIPLAQHDMRFISQKFEEITDTDLLAQELLAFKRDEIADDFQLRLNDVLTPWEEVSVKQEILLKEGQFALFRFELHQTLSPEVRQLAIVNQVHMEEVAIFHHQLNVGPGINLIDTDLLPLQDNGERHIFHGAWHSEPELRELRAVFLSLGGIHAGFEKLWRAINWRPELISAKDLLVSPPFKQRWTNGQLHLSEAGAVVLLMTLVIFISGMYKGRKYRIVVVIISLLTVGFVGRFFPTAWLELAVLLILASPWPVSYRRPVERILLMFGVLLFSSGSILPWLVVPLFVLPIFLKKRRVEKKHNYTLNILALLCGTIGVILLFLY